MLRLAVLAVLTVAAAQALAARTAPTVQPGAWLTPDDPYTADEAEPIYFEEPDQLSDTFDDILTTLDPTTHIPAPVSPDLAHVNMRATLDTIAWAEGTLNDLGYRTMFGYRYFDSYVDHPRQYFPFTDQTGRKLLSSASGRYQIIVKTWDVLRARLALPDFSPASQDAAAVELIRERGALQDAYAGRISAVASKCRMVWASLPGSNVAQPTRSLAAVVAAYQSAGGTLA